MIVMMHRNNKVSHFSVILLWWVVVTSGQDI